VVYDILKTYLRDVIEQWSIVPPAPSEVPPATDPAVPA
jgi:hypothetical protein